MAQLEVIKQRRLTVELLDIKSNPIPNIYVTPRSEQQYLTWDAIILGPNQTVWYNAVLLLEIRFDDTEYPFKPPRVKFQTALYHPNIYRNGDICLSTLKVENWNPLYEIRTILIYIQSLLSDPNSDDPANSEAAEIYKFDRHMYEMKVREAVRRSLEDMLPIELQTSGVK